MAEKVTPVVFQEGAPLDPNQLNLLMDNINSVYRMGISLQNATTNATESIRRIPVIDSGRIEVEGLTAKSPKAIDIDWNASLFTDFLNSKDTYPYVTATITAGDTFLEKAKDISLYVTYNKNPKIVLRSESAITSTFYVNWTAVAFKVVAA